MSNVNMLEKFSKFLDSLANQQEEVDDLRVEDDDGEEDFVVGEKYLIQIDTLWFFTGECEKVTPTHIVLSNVAWVQEVGRFSAFMKNKGGVAQYAEHMASQRLRVAKRHIVFDVMIDALITGTINNGNQE